MAVPLKVSFRDLVGAWHASARNTVGIWWESGMTLISILQGPGRTLVGSHSEQCHHRPVEFW